MKKQYYNRHFILLGMSSFMLVQRKQYLQAQYQEKEENNYG